MSKTTQNDSTIDEQTTKDAEKLRKASDLIDEVARNNGGVIDAFLRDLQHANETVAIILDEENGDVSPEELREKLFPQGGAQPARERTVMEGRNGR